MRPNIEEIRERVDKATSGPWQRDKACNVWSEDFPVISWSSETVKVADIRFIAHSRTDIPSLLAYIDELENMPLVQNVLNQKDEIRKLKSAIIAMKSTEMYENPTSEFQIGWNSAIDAASRRVNEILSPKKSGGTV